MLERVIPRFQRGRHIQDRLLDPVQMNTGQLDRCALVARLDVLDQPQMFVVAAGFVAVVVQRGGV
ncbi:hypothetical protein D3C85_1669320 [compost metagenome]